MLSFKKEENKMKLTETFSKILGTIKLAGAAIFFMSFINSVNDQKHIFTTYKEGEDEVPGDNFPHCFITNRVQHKCLGTWPGR